MASPSVTYTFSNGTVASATEVNQNFTDIINGITDGTKDLSISALTVAGNATFNGNVTVGNAAADDFTVTASLASTIPVKTTASFDIGSSLVGLLSMYLGRNSQTLRLIASASMSATWTLTFPTTAGTNNYALTTDGSGTTSWTAWSTSAWAATTSALGTVYLPNGMCIADTTAGWGSSGTKIRKFTNNSTTTTAVTYTANPSNNGDTFTIVHAGVYAITYQDAASATGQMFGLSLNASTSAPNDMVTAVDSIAAGKILAIKYWGGGTAGFGGPSMTRVFAANDVIRAHGDGSSTNTSAFNKMVICQVMRTA
jgi:hypothetical protein